MSFFSIEFSLVLFAFFILYWCIQSLPWQNFILLGFNYVIIYLFNPYFALIVFIYTCLVHSIAFFIDSTRTCFIFLVCICIVLLFLCFFKYYAFIKDDFDLLLVFLGLNFLQIDIIFPLGISFYTFASITYLHSIYKHGIKIEQGIEPYSEVNPKIESFLALAAYLSFFATFLAGPIMRSRDFFAQYHSKRQIGSIDMIIALVLFGLFKKAIIANYLGIYASSVLNTPFEHHSLELVCGIFAYSVQIYCDFSGYVNLVCAFGLMIGFILPLNFNMPYNAKNLKDFWNRWHISLSNFIRDYVYIPLGGNKRGVIYTQLFVFISFGLSGLWHGNTWTFLIWGLLHGFGVVWLNILRILEIDLGDIPFIGRFFTFIFVSFCWIFFYYHSLDEIRDFFLAFSQGFYQNCPSYVWWLLGGLSLLFICYPLFYGSIELIQKYLSFIPWFIKPFVLSAVLTLFIIFMPPGIPHFIYMSF